MRNIELVAQGSAGPNIGLTFNIGLQVGQNIQKYDLLSFILNFSAAPNTSSAWSLSIGYPTIIVQVQNAVALATALTWQGGVFPGAQTAMTSLVTGGVLPGFSGPVPPNVNIIIGPPGVGVQILSFQILGGYLS